MGGMWRFEVGGGRHAGDQGRTCQAQLFSSHVVAVQQAAKVTSVVWLTWGPPDWSILSNISWVRVVCWGAVDGAAAAARTPHTQRARECCAALRCTITLLLSACLAARAEAVRDPNVACIAPSRSKRMFLP
jgi:hypothetical protein